MPSDAGAFEEPRATKRVRHTPVELTAPILDDRQGSSNGSEVPQTTTADVSSFRPVGDTGIESRLHNKSSATSDLVEMVYWELLED